MKELGITVNKILKDWLQPKGEGNIVFTDDIAINEVTDEIIAECQGKYSELLQQRDELLKALSILLHLHYCEQEGIGAGQPTPEQWFKAVEYAEDVVQKAEAAIKSTETK